MTSKEMNIILTGIPRSGTTLLCKLLCEQSNTIALNEPMEGRFFINRAASLANIDGQFETFRQSLLSDGTAIARTQDGQITDNAFSSERAVRQKVIERTEVSFEKSLDQNFRLVLKQNAAFTLLLKDLVEPYTCFAMIRNPLALLASWNSVEIPVSKGRVAKAARLQEAFYEGFTAIDDLYDRQLFILDWYFQQYSNLPQKQILRYEHLIAEPSAVLSTVANEACEYSIPLENKNQSPLYDSDLVRSLGEKLLQNDGAYWDYYSKEEVGSLVENYSDA